MAYISVIRLFCVYLHREMEKVIKLFKRLCKDEGVFAHRKIVKSVIDHIKTTGNCVFYGICGYNILYSDKEQMAFYKIQLELAVRLIEKNELSSKEKHLLLVDTLTRYNLSKKNNLPVEIIKNWENVVKHSNKGQIAKIIKAYIPPR